MVLHQAMQRNPGIRPFQHPTFALLLLGVQSTRLSQSFHQQPSIVEVPPLVLGASSHRRIDSPSQLESCEPKQPCSPDVSTSSTIPPTCLHGTSRSRPGSCR